MILEFVGVVISLAGLLGGGYIIKSLIVDPIVAFRSVIVDVEEDFIYYEHVIRPENTNSDEINEACDALRQNASRLESRANNVLNYRLWSIIGILPDRDDVTDAKESLIGISNLVWSRNRDKKSLSDPTIHIEAMEKEVKSLLNIE